MLSPALWLATLRLFPAGRCLYLVSLYKLTRTQLQRLPGVFTCCKGTTKPIYTTVGWTHTVSDQLVQLNSKPRQRSWWGLREAGAEGAPDDATVGQKTGTLPASSPSVTILTQILCIPSVAPLTPLSHFSDKHTVLKLQGQGLQQQHGAQVHHDNRCPTVSRRK